MGKAYGRIPTRIQTQRIADYAEGNTLSYENSSFTSVASPAVIDFYTDSNKRTCHNGYMINDGPGDIKFEFSTDSINYGGIHTMRPGEQLDLSRYSIQRLRLTWVANTSYRILMA